VRHALQWLEHEGYLVALGSGPKSRMTVAPLTESDAIEAYRIVGHMEGLAGRLAADLPKRERSELIKKLRQLNSRMAKSSGARKSDPRNFFDLDTSFHSQIVEATAGSRFVAIYNGIKPHTERYWWLYASSIRDDENPSIEEHTKIVAAIAEGDPDAAEKALQLNWENGAKRLVDLIRRFGERGKW
jgi:DNA-binding GntR family transcriptional regulator